MAKILISYRRGDADTIVYRIHDTLVRRYDKDTVFIDIDNIPYGTDFREHLSEVLDKIDALLAIIGTNWLASVQRSETESKTDYVRMEIETALKRKIPVVPVLVNNAEMPEASKLPKSLEPLAYRHAAEIDAGRDFAVHMERLADSVDQILGGRTKPRKEKEDEKQKKDELTRGFQHISSESRVAISVVLFIIGLLIIGGVGLKRATPAEGVGVMLGSFSLFSATVILSKKTRFFSIFIGFIIYSIFMVAVNLSSQYISLDGGNTYHDYLPESFYFLSVFGSFFGAMGFVLFDNWSRSRKISNVNSNLHVPENK